MRRFRRLVWLLPLCLAACFPTIYSRHPGLAGVVTDIATGQPVAGAVVVYESLGLSTTTDEQGSYHFPGKTYVGLAVIGGEGAHTSAGVLVTKPGYEPAHEFRMSGFGGGNGRVEWKFDIQLLAETHPIVRWAAQLQEIVQQDGGYDTWLEALRRMKGEGLTREDAMLMFERYPDILSILPKSPENDAARQRLLYEIYNGEAIWLR